MTMQESPTGPTRIVPELRVQEDPPSWVHPEWANRFPWLAQGTTGRGADGESSDFAIFRDGDAGGSPELWLSWASARGFSGVVHSRQVHGALVLAHAHGPRGLHIAEDADGHVCRTPGLLLAVTVADCVPVFLVDEKRRAVGLLHAGWRGTVRGVLEAGIRGMGRSFGTSPRELTLHLGPSICGSCYEVGPEVHRALGRAEPPHPTPLDLRALLAARAVEVGVSGDEITRSAWCTLCDAPRFFSHRGGDPERQVGYLGIFPEPSP